MSQLYKILFSIKKLIIVFLISVTISLIIDFLFGNKILEISDKYWKNTEFYGRIIAIDHPVYHHGLKPNVIYEKSRGFNGNFVFCTDNHGFKFKCGANRDKKFEIGFMGDSFAEGVSLPYEQTFVGMYESISKKNVANLSVNSYSTKIYLSKINYLLNNDYKFNHIIVFIDVSDLYDDSVYYKINENLIIDENYEREKKLKLRKFLRNNFPFTNFYLFVIKNINKHNENTVIKNDSNPEFNEKVNLKAKWTYANSETIDGYLGTIEANQQSMLQNMNKLYEILKRNKIELSLAVYPWPHQLKENDENSKHVQMWKDFCVSKCKNFINFFPIFFEEKDKKDFLSIYKKYYFWNDIHFNYEGNKLIMKELIKILK